MRFLLPLTVLAAALALLAPARSEASPYVRYGVQDDAWLADGPGTLDQRLDTLQRLGVDVVRYDLRWNEIAPSRPALARSPADPAYAWSAPDAILQGLHARGIAALVTILGSPRWANGGRTPNWAPASGSSIAGFAYAAAKRYPFVHLWTVWNEPNKSLFLRPTVPAVYVSRLLNPAYAAIHAASPASQVAGGVTGPRAGSPGNLSPIAWMRGMAAAHARLDAYAHNPYPTNPHTQTPTGGACGHCTTITMASLPRLIAEVKRDFGTKRIWLTEYAYQTNPPDPYLGVSKALQARYLGEAAGVSYRAPGVDILIHFIVRDEPSLGGWQSGLFALDGEAKPALRAFMLPLAELSRRGERTALWGQVRPRFGAQPYRLEQFRSGRWVWVGGTRLTSARGYLSRVVHAGRGAEFRIWSPRDLAYSPILTTT